LSVTLQRGNHKIAVYSKNHATSIEKYHAKYNALPEHAITTKHTTNWPKTKILQLETDLKKRLFLESFFINTNGNIMNSKTNYLFTSVYEFAFGVQRNILNIWFVLVVGVGRHSCNRFLEDQFVPSTVCALRSSLTCRSGCASSWFLNCIAEILLQRCVFEKRLVLLSLVLCPVEVRSLTGRNLCVFVLFSLKTFPG